MRAELNIKYQEVRRILRANAPVCIAFSGGVDSSLLLKIASDELGDMVVGMYCDSVLQPSRERRSAAEIAGSIGVDIHVLEGIDLSHKAFRLHPENRCYLCKGLIFDRIIAESRRLGYHTICDGSNTDDINDHRPGRRALLERGVISPLQDAGLNKNEIREMSRQLGLSTWNKDALACLATRIPFHEEVNTGKLQLIDKVEDFLYSRGYRNIRARLFADKVLVEVDPLQVEQLIAEADELDMETLLTDTAQVKITIDKEGYKQGKMNDISTNN